MPTQTGFVKPYGTYLYGPYKPNDDLFHFEPEPLNPALPNKHRVFDLMTNNQSRVYKFSNFNGGKVVRENIFNKDYLVVGDENIIVAFETNTSTNYLTFTYDFDNSEMFFKDNEGNKRDMFGNTLDGPIERQTLITVNSMTSM